MPPSLTYDLAAATERIGAPSTEWLIVNLRHGRFPGRKIGRHWRLTDDDIQAILDICSNRHQRLNPKKNVASASVATGLTPTSRKRVAGL
ncbi:hypothetical protein MSZK_54580 [Mycobacterium sp. shizuoka-1]|nr:hypothetical protein MSZK_54580 [Mycobacterium sp. shizuoka-1]